MGFVSKIIDSIFGGDDETPEAAPVQVSAASPAPEADTADKKEVDNSQRKKSRKGKASLMVDSNNQGGNSSTATGLNI